jgi:hypothetical protein
MPDQVTKQVNQIGAWEKQGWAFHFLNWQSEPYEWTNAVAEDNPEFQGLLGEE